MEAGKRILALVSAGTVLGFACAVRAETFTPVPGLGDTALDLDTQSGNFSEWQIHGLGTINALRATLQVHRLGQDPKWAPGATITLASAEEKVEFQILSPTEQPPLSIHVMHYAGQTMTDDMPLTTTIGLDQPLEVSIDWAKTGIVNIRLGSGEARAVSLKSKPTSLEIAGSTGEVIFNPLKIGRIKR